MPSEVGMENPWSSGFALRIFCKLGSPCVPQASESGSRRRFRRHSSSLRRNDPPTREDSARVALAAVVLIESCGRHIAFVCENVAARNVPSAQAESDTAGVLARPGRPRRRRLRRPLLDTAVIAGWLTQSELAKPGTAERNERRGW